MRGPDALGDMVVARGDPARALARLHAGLAELRLQATAPMLRHALSALQAGRVQEGSEAAIKALQVDERCGIAWHVLAICREKLGDFASSLAAYEAALQLIPDDPDLANNVGQLAYRMGQKDIAEALFRRFLASAPASGEGANNLACALRDRMAFDEAIEVLRPAIVARPADAMLWNTLATVMNEQGDIAQAVTFLDEAVRLDPDFARALYNRANARLALGEVAGGLADADAAIARASGPSDLAMMRLARAFLLIASGRLAEGWETYAARHDPHFSGVLHFAADAPRWTPQAELAGRTLLVVGEQGLGDEVLFSNVLPDVIEALGPQGKLKLAVEARLVDLFRRAFPQAEVGGHVTRRVDLQQVRFAPLIEDWKAVDLWAPLGDLLTRFRPHAAAFPPRSSFLTPDPERVAHWRGALAALGAGVTVGITWKSLKMDSARARFYAPFPAWEGVLRTPGVRFVNLQCGDCEAELAHARDRCGVEVWTPPGLDLKDDLDDVAALTCALDLTLGSANATTNLAGACGAAYWMIAVPGAWTRLGRPDYPWYPRTRAFTPAAFNAWEPVMAEMAAALAARVEG